MVSLISRAGWGAAPPSQRLQRITSTRGVKVHYTGGWVDPRIVDDHRECIALMLSIQRMHMAGGRGEKYSDFGYNMAACPHRRVFVGRGPNFLPAANGPGLNSQHYAVLAMVGSKGYVVPGEQLLHGVLDAIDYLREHGNAGREIKRHGDGYATDCPGARLTAWVRAGAPRPGGGTSAPSTSWMENLVAELPTLKQGVTSFDVKTLRGCLFARGGLAEASYSQAGLKAWLESTVFDAPLTAVVKAFQKTQKLDADGIVGPKTWQHLLRVA
jgi:peptidoglycan hydrolase-like protein with peptidoglycan-binding domain